MARIGWMVCVVAMGLLACEDSGGDGSGDGDGIKVGPRATAAEQTAACDALEACGAPRDDCELLFEVSVLSRACAQAIETASCEAHRGASPAYLDTCYPPCTAGDIACTSDGQAAAACSDSLDGTPRRLVLPCEAVCAQNGGTWSGACGDSYMGQQSRSGQDSCWCE